MSGSVVSPLLKGLLRKINSLFDERTKSTYNDLEGEFKAIVATLQTISAVVENAEEQPIGKGIFTIWLEGLQDVLYEVDDLVDELHIMIQVSSSPLSSTRFIRTIPSKSKLAPSLRHIRQALIELEQRAAHYGFGSYVKSVHVSLQRESEIYSYVDLNEVIGRRSDVEAVIDLILRSIADADQHRVTAVPIVGGNFIGKTTLARLIYNNRSLYDKNFDLKLWLWLGGCHDMPTFLEIMSCQLIKDHHLEDYKDTKTTRMDLCKLIGNKRLLIVLDDLRDSNFHKTVARELIDMLSNSKGSAIVVTTRSRRAASLIGTIPPYQLQPLSPDASYQLLSRAAGWEEDYEDKHIAMEFVKSCSGVPPIMTMVATCLHNRKEWKSFLEYVHEHGFTKIVEDKGWFSSDMFEIPSHLKLPLQSFCLQKACGLSVEALICVWMALGFLYSADTAQLPEYIARKILTEFVQCTLCPDAEHAPGGVVRHIKFNDALYDLATTSANPWWATVHDEKKFIGSPMYIIWDLDCVRRTLLPSDHIRDPRKVLLFTVRTRQRAPLQIVRDIVSCLVRLRVLGLGGCDVEMLPDSIGELKHLRYLDLGRNPRMESLPDSICSLWHLQTIFLHGCSIKELPANIGRLKNLRYLTLTILTESLPDAIAELTSLRTLSISSCPKLASLPSSIENLKNLQTFAVVNCPELDLASSSFVQAFKGLEALQTLLLSHLPNFASLPSDLGNLSVELRHLQILFCRSLTETKWIAQFRALRSLTIEVCPQLLDLTLTNCASQLDGLLELVIRRCPSLGYTAWIRQFVSLRSLIIDSCPKLVELDDGFHVLKNLERLEIRGCPALTKWFKTPAGKEWRHIFNVLVIEVDGSHLEP